MKGRPVDPLGQPVGVGYVVDNALLVHSRSPARVTIFPAPGAPAGTAPINIPLEGNDDAETAGTHLFHTASRGITCASCHAEGHEDGHVWTFFDRPRRTQTLTGGLSQTAPFHWKGDLTDMNALLSDTFVARMGGTMPTPVEVAELTSFLDSLPAPRAPTPAQPVDLTKGRAAFDKAGCASCHAGARMTNRSNTNVGSGDSWQTPSLIGLGRRAPYMHDGCAKTIEDRFTNPACGGTSHGNVSALNAQELADLTSFLTQL
jgi:mono/diheme cytochrome c family protein